MIKKALSKDITMVQIEKISIFQKLEKNPCEDELYRWKFSEDSTSRHIFKLFTGKFASDLTWLLVTSVAKQLTFDVRSIEGQIVYQIWDGDTYTYSQNSEQCSKAVTFKLENGTLSPVVVSFAPTDAQNVTPDDELNDSGSLSLYDVLDLRRSKRRNVQPERYLGCDELPDPDIDISRIGLIRESKLDYEDIPMALSVQDDHAHKTQKHRTDGHKTDRQEEMDKIISSYRKEVFGSLLNSQRNIKQMDLSSDSSDEEQEIIMNDQGEHPSQSAIVPLSTENNSGAGEVYPLAAEVSGTSAADISKIVSKYYSDRAGNVDEKRTSRTYYSKVEQQKKKKPAVNYSLVHSGWGWKAAYKRYPRAKRLRSTVTDWQNIYDHTRSSSTRRAFSASVYRELIRRCMTDIDSVVGQEQPPILDQWKEFQSNSSNQNEGKEKKDMDENEAGIPEEPEDSCEEEVSEIDILWKEMDMALASAYLLDEEVII